MTKCQNPYPTTPPDADRRATRRAAINGVLHSNQQHAA